MTAEPPDHIVAENEFGVYCVPRSSLHRPASKKILASEVWEPDTVNLVRAVDPQGDLIHAGTFFGDFIPALSRSRQGNALVWAFEPSRESELPRLSWRRFHLELNAAM